MSALPHDLFDEPVSPSPLTYLHAFEAWLVAREKFGTLRERSSVAVYRSMWGALSAWCVARGLHLDDLQPQHFEGYLRSRSGPDDLSDRYAWRLLSLADEVLAQRSQTTGISRNMAAMDLLMGTPEWRFANAADKTPLPEHLQAHEARALVSWLLGHGARGTSGEALSPSSTWQDLRNRCAVALQLGAGLTPSDVRAATLEGVMTRGGRVKDLPWKIRLPAHGSCAQREAPMSAWAARLLQSWLSVRSDLQIPGTMLFPATRGGRPWGKVAQYNAAKAVLAAAGLPDAEGGSFKLRHTFALRQLRRGTAAEQVAQWMGLADAVALSRHRRIIIAPPDEVV